MINHITRIIHVAFEECCLPPSIGYSSCAVGSGVYCVITVQSPNIKVEAWLPEDGGTWDRMVILFSPLGSESFPITKLIDELQKTKNMIVV